MRSIITTLYLCYCCLGQVCLAGDSRLDDIKIANTRVSGTSTRLSTVTFWVDEPIEKVWKVLIDYNHHAEYLPKLNEAFLVKPEVAREILPEANLKLIEKRMKDNMLPVINTDTVYLYNNYDFPFPLADHHSLLEVVLDTINHKLRWTQVAGDMKVNYGSWEIKQVDSMVFASYAAYGDPGIPIPAFLIKMVTKMVLPNIVRAVREQSAK